MITRPNLEFEQFSNIIYHYPSGVIPKLHSFIKFLNVFNEIEICNIERKINKMKKLIEVKYEYRD